MSLTWQMSAFRFNFCCNQVENECSFFKSTKRNVINVKIFFREILEKHDGLDWLLPVQQLWVKKQRSRSCSWSCVSAQHSLRFPAFHTVKLFVRYKNIKHPQCRCSTSNTTNCNTSCIREDLCQHSKIFKKTRFPISLHSCRRPAPSWRGLTEHLQQSTIRWSSALTLSSTSRPICWRIQASDCTVTFFLGPPPPPFFGTLVSTTIGLTAWHECLQVMFLFAEEKSMAQIDKLKQKY